LLLARQTTTYNLTRLCFPAALRPALPRGPQRHGSAERIVLHSCDGVELVKGRKKSNVSEFLKISIFTLPSRRDPRPGAAIDGKRPSTQPALPGGFSLHLSLCVPSGWLSGPTRTVTASCGSRSHHDAPQRLRTKSACFRMNVHKRNQLCHQPPLWEIFSDLHTLSLSSHCTQSSSEKKSQTVFLHLFSTCRLVTLITLRRCLKSKAPELSA